MNAFSRLGLAIVLSVIIGLLKMQTPEEYSAFIFWMSTIGLTLFVAGNVVDP